MSSSRARPVLVRPPRRAGTRQRAVARWGRFALLSGITAVVLAPVLVGVGRALTGFDGRPSLQGVVQQLAMPETLGWFGNSLAVTAVTVALTIAVAAPAGYALSRGRSRRTDLFALLVFAMQSLPVIVLTIPLFLLLVPLGLVDTLQGLTIVYVGVSVAVGIWTMTAYFDSVPIALEEAAWLDGCSVLGAFRRVVLPNAGPGLLTTAVVTFLLAWNDYWIALTFVITDTRFTIGLALVSSRQTPALALLGLLPPLIVFAVLHRRFRLGGIAGALVG